MRMVVPRFKAALEHMGLIHLINQDYINKARKSLSASLYINKKQQSDFLHRMYTSCTSQEGILTPTSNYSKENKILCIRLFF